MRFLINEYNLSAAVGLRLAFVSDLHNFKNEPVIKAIKENKVDAILIGGDFLHGELYAEQGFEFLKQAAKIAPTYCALGNHEAAYSGPLRQRIIEAGCTVLDNDYVTLKGANIGGLTSGVFYYGRGKKPNLNFLTEFSQLKGYKLLVCHHPEYYGKYIKSLPIDLTVSGHAHGGQWRLFGRGVFAPGQGFFPKYTSGMYDGRLLVCRGLGNVYVVPKINNPPEILIINI